MSATTNAGRIAAWRRAHPGVRLTTARLREILGITDLREADLRGADLRGADLRGAYLRDLLTVTGLPSGDLTLLPTPEDGWWLRVGCWSGTVDALAELVAQDTGWPEARGDEVARRRPGLEAAIMLARAHIALHPDAIERVTREREEWEAEKARRTAAEATPALAATVHDQIEEDA